MTAYGRHLATLWRELDAYLAFYSEVPRPPVPVRRQPEPIWIREVGTDEWIPL